MRTAMFVTGLIAGILGTLIAILELAAGSVMTSWGDPDGSLAIGFGIGTLVFATLGLVGACLRNARPGLGSIFCGLAMLGIVTGSVLYLPSLMLFLAAMTIGIIAWARSRSARVTSQHDIEITRA